MTMTKAKCINPTDNEYCVIYDGQPKWKDGHPYEKLQTKNQDIKNKIIEGHGATKPLKVTNGVSTGRCPLWYCLLVIIGLALLAGVIGVLVVLLSKNADNNQVPAGNHTGNGISTTDFLTPVITMEPTTEVPATDPVTTTTGQGQGPMKATHLMTCDVNDNTLAETNRGYFKPSDVCWVSENQIAVLTVHYLVIMNIDRKNKTCLYKRASHIRGVIATRLACASNGFVYAKVDRWHNRGLRAATNVSYGGGWFPPELQDYIKQYTVSTDSILIESGNFLYIYDLDKKFKEKLPINVQGPPSYGPAYLSTERALWRTTTAIGSTGLWVYDINTQKALVINGTHTYGVTGVGQYVFFPDYYNGTILVYSQWGQYYRNLQMDRVIQKPVNVAAIGKSLAVIPDTTWNVEIFDLQ